MATLHFQHANLVYDQVCYEVYGLDEFGNQVFYYRYGGLNGGCEDIYDTGVDRIYIIPDNEIILAKTLRIVAVNLGSSSPVSINLNDIPIGLFEADGNIDYEITVNNPLYPVAAHTVTLTSSPITVVYINPAGTVPFTVQVEDGQSITLQVPSTAEGYLFNHWEINGVDVGSENPGEVGPILEDVTVEAAYLAEIPPEPPEKKIPFYYWLLLGIPVIGGVFYLAFAGKE